MMTAETAATFQWTMLRAVSFRRIRGLRWLVVLAMALELSKCASAQTRNSDLPSGPYRIAGTVVHEKGGCPLPRCRVTIADSKNRHSVQSVITGDDGRFEFHVPAGKYSLQGAKRGFVSAAYNQHEQYSTAIVTGAGIDTENLVLRLGQNAVLSGKVLDERGDPVEQAQVMVYREDHSQGVSHVFMYRGAGTDDLGRYEVAPVEPGTYFVSAKASPWYAVPPVSNVGAGSLPSHVDPSLDVTYPVTYYGDVTESAEATLIPVRSGERVEADIHLNPVSALHFVVHIPEGGDMNRFPQLSQPSFGGTEQFAGGNLRGFGNGLFEISGVAPGRYTVRMPGADGQMKEPAEVNLESSGELDVSQGQSTSQVRATVQIAGASTVPPQLRIVLRGSKGRGMQSLVDAEGKANFGDVPAGKYEVLASSPTQRYSVARISSQAGAVSGHSLNVTSGTSLNIELSLVGGAAIVEGFAKRNGKAVAGAMIVLVPKNAEEDRDRFRRDESDLDGSFSLRNVIPGSYTVIAIEDGWDLEWGEPAVLSQYLKRAQAIDVGDRQSAAVQVADPVEVQSK